jgi:hypothetical protein
MIDESLGPHCRWTDTDSGTEYKVQVAFQVRIRPGTYSIGQHTLAEGRTRTFDETGTYSNNEVGPGHLYFMGVAGVARAPLLHTQLQLELTHTYSGSQWCFWLLGANKHQLMCNGNGVPRCAAVCHGLPC